MTSVDGSATGPTRTRRADSERNRNAILAAAGDLLCSAGHGFDVREIAERSGVGMGTLYRHFPTKEDLLGTVLEQLLNSWATTAREAAEQIDDPLAALQDFFEQMLTGQGRGPALARCYAAKSSDPAASPARILQPIIDDLRIRAQSCGAIRADLTTEDLVVLLASLSQSAQSLGQNRPDAWRRVLRISLDGLSSRHLEPLPD